MVRSTQAMDAVYDSSIKALYFTAVKLKLIYLTNERWSKINWKTTIVYILISGFDSYSVV